MAMVAYAKTRYYGPALTNSAGTAQWTQGDPFLNVQSWAYWTGSQYSNYISTAWYVNMYGGALVGDGISSNYNVWPVRAGQ
jgi:hypothetical protein